MTMHQWPWGKLIPLFIGVLSQTPVEAQPAVCHMITAPQTPPAGFGAPYNTQSAQQEILMKADCPGTMVDLTVGNKQDFTYAYHQGYWWDGLAWRRFDYACSREKIANAWCVGEQTGVIPSSSSWYVAYTCHWMGNQWKCGCRDAVCRMDPANDPARTGGLWQLQRVDGAVKPVLPITTIAEDLKVPWDLAFLPEGNLLVTERGGDLTLIQSNGSRTAIPINRVEPKGEGGLLGLVLHPDFSKNRLVYIYLTALKSTGGLENRVEQYRFSGNALMDRRVIIGSIPGAVYHDGGRLRFGPDGKLYIMTGDAGNSQLSQDRGSLAGKILRINPDGSIPGDNPFQTAVYSWGHRNPQGIAWDNAGRLWSTEHGRSGSVTGMDELNRIVPGGNYGWPVIEGDQTRSGMIAPAVHSGPDVTWAPASAVYWDNSIFFGGLRGEALYEAVLEGERVRTVRRHFHERFGRIRTVVLGPDGMFYLTTSNRDGRGTVRSGDDKIIRIDPRTLR